MTARPRPDRLVIGIPTFRRESLLETLESLRSIGADPDISVLIADNDTIPSARGMVERESAVHPLELHYVHAPERNISIARNALLDNARARGARWLACLDDDERAPPGWLEALLVRQAETGAAVVLGPVRGEYEADAPAWLVGSGLHDLRPVIAADGHIATGYTSNALIDLEHPALAGLRFDLSRGRSGGEDTMFFAGAVSAGARIAYAPAALVHEDVPAGRTRLSWLLSRRFRMGQTHADVLSRGRGPAGRMAQAALASGKFVACLGLAAGSLASRSRCNCQLVRAALHLGVVARLAGMRPIPLYGGKQKPLLRG